MTTKRTLFKDLLAGRAYQVEIRAVGDGVNTSNSDWSNTLEFTTDSDGTAAGTPSGLSASVEDKAFYASWTAPSDGDVAGYEVTIYPTATPSDGVMWFVQDTFVTLESEVNRAVFNAYQGDLTIEVASRDLGGNVSAVASTTATNTAPGAFTLSVTDRRSGAWFTWTEPSGGDIDYYEVYRGGSPIATTTSRYFVDLFDAGTSQSYYIKAYDIYGNTTDSNTVNVTIETLDDRYVDEAGDTMTGALIIDVSSASDGILKLWNGDNGNGDDFDKQILFGWSGNNQYKHAIATRHNASGVTKNAIDFYVWQNSQAAGDIGDNHVMQVDGTGVGIFVPKNESPAGLLHLKGADAEGNGLRIEDSGTTNWWDLYVDSTGDLFFNENGDELIRFNNTGTIQFGVAGDTNLYRSAPDTLKTDDLFIAGLGVDANSNFIINVTNPVNPQDAATKNYVDTVAQGLDAKDSVRAATTGNITLSGTQTVDGVALIAGDRVLVKNQTDATQNGIYTVAAGAWTRTADQDEADEFAGAFVFVEEGTTNADSGFVCTTDEAVTIGVTDITWSQFSGAGQITAGAGMTKTGNTLDVIATAGGGIIVNADDLGIDWGETGDIAQLGNAVGSDAGVLAEAARADHTHDIADDYVLNTGDTMTGKLTIDTATDEKIRLNDTSTGDSAVSYIGFFDGVGTRIGYIGDASATNDNIYIASDNGHTTIQPTVGNLGVGTGSSDPAKKLHVVGDTLLDSTSDVNLADGTGVLQIGPNGAGNIGIDGNEIIARNGAGGAAILYMQAEGGTVAIGSNISTNVGIGTSAPDDLLHIYGGNSGATPSGGARLIVEDDINAYINIVVPDASESGVLFGRVTGGSADGGIVYDNVTYPRSLSFRTSGNTTRMVLNDTGDLRLDLADAGDTISWGSAADTTLYRDGAASLRMNGNMRLDNSLYVDGVEAVLFDEMRLTHSEPYTYIQAGTSAADTGANLVISRRLTGTTNISSFQVYADDSTFYGNVYGRGTIYAANPNNTGATVGLRWLADEPTLRIGGTGAGSTGTFKVQGISDFTRMSLDSAGNVDFPGNVSFDGTLKNNSSYRLDGPGLGTEYTYGEKTFVTANWAAIADQVAYIDFGNIDWLGVIEVEISGGWSAGNAAGLIRKRIVFFHDLNATSFGYYESENDVVVGNIRTGFAVGELEIHNTNNFRLPIYKIQSSWTSRISIKIKAWAEGASVPTDAETILDAATYVAPTTVANSQTALAPTFVVNPYVGTDRILTEADLTNLDDADTLDGLDSTQFLRSDVADTAAGKITLNGGLDVAYNASPSMQVLAGQTSAGAEDKIQIAFGFNGGTNYRHGIRTRHNAGSTQGNAIDFYTWAFGVDAAGDHGTNHVMQINQNGVGIFVPETAAPSSELEVRGTLHVNNTTDAEIIIEDTVGDNQVRTRYSTASYDWIVGVHGGEAKFKIDRALTFDTTPLFVIEDAGNVGIGVNTPSDFWSQAEKFVVGGAANDGMTIYSTNTGRIAFADTTTGNPGLDSGGLITFNHAVSHLAFRVENVDEMYINASGVEVPSGDVEISTSTNGVILKSPDGTRWRVTIDNTGNLTSTAL